MCRTVTLVLVDGAGAPLGALPPLEVDNPYWPEVAGVVAAAREAFGLDVAVLRILATDRATPHGGSVTYLAQADDGPGALLTPAEVDLSPHPQRAEYARPGGPAASLRWAAAALDEVGRGPLTNAVQQRTWNLSAIWRLETPGGPVWLKQVPRFFAHEPAVLRWIADLGYGHLVPPVVAAGAGRMLLDHVAGEDLYRVDATVRDAIAAEFHPIQIEAARRTGELLERGVPDRRAAPLARAIRDVVARHGGGDARLDTLVADLDERLAKVAACGLPETLVHGDLHPGNVRGDGRRHVVLDWGDSCVAHPAFDILRMTEDVEGAGVGDLIGAWAARWRAGVPACDPEAAVELMRPVAALRNAAAYSQFLDAIEPAEHPYHAADVGFWLSRAADLA